jgi:hypothetical protein
MGVISEGWANHTFGVWLQTNYTLAQTDLRVLRESNCKRAVRNAITQLSAE